MDLNRSRRHAVYSWLFVAVVVALCLALGALQYRWLGEVSEGEQDRLRRGLQVSLNRFSQDFNNEISAACAAVMPELPPREEAPNRVARLAPYVSHWSQWKESGRQAGLFGRVGVVLRDGGKLELRMLEPAAGATWPESWKPLRDRLQFLVGNDEPGPGPRRPFGDLTEDQPALIEIPRLAPGGPREGRERGLISEWLLLEVDLDYVRSNLIQELLQRHLGGGLDYQAEIVMRDKPSTLLFSSEGGASPRIGVAADASVALFEMQYEQIFRRGGPRFGRRGGERGRLGPPDRGRWLLSVQHRAGSLEAVVNQVRLRNLAVSGGILVLMMAAVAALLRFTRRAQHLAALEMEFVAGVSHELRTPLSVIRTAGHNLGRGVVRDPGQVERYGTLIRNEAERLGLIVEQVLKFSAAKAGQVIGERRRLEVAGWLEEILAANAAAIQQGGCRLEKALAEGLPAVLADPVALRQAVENLLGNALKYGSAGERIEVAARTVEDGAWVEITVADRGPGIAADELAQIFDPFYRGKRAVGDQIHGTGLGLSLVRRIVEAHGGNVKAHSRPGERTEFAIRIPAAAPETDDELSNPAG
jgi:signal transduction histidine kinase